MSNPCCNETPCQWGDHPCDRKKPMSDTPRNEFLENAVYYAAKALWECSRFPEAESLQAAYSAIHAQRIDSCPDGQKCSNGTTGICWGRCVRTTHVTHTLQLVRQAIFHVLDTGRRDGLAWDFDDDEERVDFADAVQAWIVK